MPRVHVMPDRDKWKIVVDGKDEDRTYSTQEEASQAGRERAKQLRAEFQVQGKDGTVREKDSYGNDPRDIEG